MRFATYGWPGLVQIADRGNWSGLAHAAGFALLLNLAFVSSFVWSELLPPTLRNGLWGLVAVGWLAGLGYSVRWRRRAAADRAAGSSGIGTFEEATGHYLKGNWFEAERVLVGLLHGNSDDAEARLMLATLLRRRCRWSEAAGQLELLSRLDGAARWELELGRERQLLREAKESETERNDQDTAQNTTAETTAEMMRAA